MIINIENKTKPAINLNSLSASTEILFNLPNASLLSQSNQHNINSTNDSSIKSMQKGQKVSLSKLCPNINEIQIELGWQTDNLHDINAEAFLLDSQDKIIGDNWFVFYNQETSPDGSVKIESKSNTNKEIIHVTLSKINSMINKIVFVLTIDEALQKHQNFSQVSNAYILIKNKSTNTVLIKFNLTDYYENIISMMIGELYYKNNEWRFNAIGNGTNDDLLGLCIRYGVDVKEE